MANGYTCRLPVDEPMIPRLVAALLVLAAYITPANPTRSYIDTVIAICADIYNINTWDTYRIMQPGSEWNPNMPGDKGKSVGLWQWKEESMRAALGDMGIVWDWETEDPRLNLWAATLAACHSLSKGWDWWTTRERCERMGE